MKIAIMNLKIKEKYKKFNYIIALMDNIYVNKKSQIYLILS